MIRQAFRLLTIATCTIAAICLIASEVPAQVGDVAGGFGTDVGGVGTDLGGGGGVGGDVGGGTTNTGGNLGGGGGGGGGASAGQAPNLGDLLNMNLEADIPIIEDRRRKGFIGPNSELGRAINDAVPPTGFVGANSESFAAGGGATGGAAGRAGGQAGGQGGQAGAGQQNGFVVTRRNIRTRLRPAFQTLPANGEFVSTRFQNRMLRQPSTSGYGQNVRVNVQNRTAVVSGSVQSADEADRIIRQLRLEPGVYRIDNQLSVGN